jgi:two-component system, OmpR family, catabolic regulation response regulator CreB
VDTIQYALETDGFDTVCAASGGPAPGILASERIDLIVLDIGLPDINGVELCKEIRKVSQVQVIFLTARSDEVDRVVGLEHGLHRAARPRLHPGPAHGPGLGRARSEHGPDRGRPH